MHPADIKSSLHKKGTSPAKVARDLQLNRSTVSRVIAGTATSRRVATEISRVLGKSASKLWPGKYADSQKTLAV